jgi:low affinity Fe/Cu permease
MSDGDEVLQEIVRMARRVREVEFPDAHMHVIVDEPIRLTTHEDAILKITRERDTGIRDGIREYALLRKREEEKAIPTKRTNRSPGANAPMKRCRK